MIIKDTKHGVRFTATLLVILLAIFCNDASRRHAHGSQSASPPERPYALVIGVADYDHWPDIPQAIDNAHKVARLLETGGFEVQLVENPSATFLNAALEALVYPAGQLAARDIVVYYCGQSASKVQTDGTDMGWIIPRDCPQPADQPDQFESQAVSTRTIEAYAGQIKSRRVIMFFDAALAGDIFAIEPPALRMAGPHNTQPVRQYIIAGQADEPIMDHNVFADTLIQALGGQADAVQDGQVTGSELAVFIASRIAQATQGRINPQYGKSRNPELSRGDFVFNKIELSAGSRLHVRCRPADARIKILNIQPKFAQGISLAPGKYKIEVSAAGHATQRKWITLVAGRDTEIRVDLKKLIPVTVNTLGMAMKWIDADDFFMGSPDDEPGRQSDEEIVRVRLTDGFRMQTTEVSVGQFSQFIANTGYRTQAEQNGGCWVPDTTGRWRLSPDANWKTAGPWMKSDGKKCELLPVTCVSWNDAMAFAHWLSEQEDRTYDLPTEAQWEMACRAGTRSPFAYGQCIDLRSANYAAAGTFYTQCGHQPNQVHPHPKPIDVRLKNRWDLSDMHGNAAEWCRDWYGPYSKSRKAGTTFGTERVFRGGHFGSPADQCRCANRSSFKPDAAASVIGFRLVQISSP